MKKKTNVISDIKKGNKLEENLLIFGNELSSMYARSSALNFLMNYVTYFTEIHDKELDKGTSKQLKQLNAIVKDLVEDSVSDATVTKIEKLREDVKTSVDSITALLSAFENFNFVLSRKITNKKYEGKDIDIDEETRAILNYIFEDDDNIAINAKIQRVISELPVRYTKLKFMDIVENSVDKYLGTEKKAFQAFSYMVRQAGMIINLKKINKCYPDIYEEFEYFKNYDYEKATKKTLLKESVRLNSIIATCSELSDQGISLMGTVNDLYSVIINWENLDKSDISLELELMKYTNDSFSDKALNFDDFNAKIEKSFKNLEGKLESLMPELDRYEGTLFHIQEHNTKDIEKFDYSGLYTRLYKCSVLRQGSLFATFKELEDIGEVKSKDIEKLKKNLKKEFDTIFSEVDRNVRRGIIAQVLGSVPVYFENRTDVMDYIKTSLESCTTRDELVGTVNAITEIIFE